MSRSERVHQLVREASQPPDAAGNWAQGKKAEDRLVEAFVPLAGKIWDALEAYHGDGKHEDACSTGPCRGCDVLRDLALALGIEEATG